MSRGSGRHEVDVAGTNPLVTVVLTVHTRTDFLRDALSSVLAQTFTDYEVIVADDSGTSAACDICASFADEARVRYRPNDHTQGTAVSLRGAFNEARGRYLAILNDDDRWEPDFLACLVPPLEADNRRVLAFSDHWVTTQDGTIDVGASDRNTALYGRTALREGDVADVGRFVVRRNGVPLAMASVFRRSAFDACLLVPEVSDAYDFWIACLLAAAGGASYYVPKRLTLYRVHPRMETARRGPRKTESLVFVFRRLLENNCFPELRPYLQRRLGRAICHVGRDRLYFNETAEARSFFASALRTSPDWRPLALWLFSLLPFGARKMFRISGD